MLAAKHSEMSSSCQALLSEPHIPTPQPNSHPRQYVIVLPRYPPPGRQLLLGKTCVGCRFCFPTSLLFLFAAAYLLWPSDPDLSIVRLRLDCLHFYTRPKISLDVTMDLKVRVFNKDFYSMNYDSLLVAIGYRGKALGHVTSDGGHIKARGSSYVNATLQLDRVEILSDVILLLEDLAKGAVTFDTVSEVVGKLRVFFFDLHLKTKMKCAVIVNTRNQTIARQSCYTEVSEVR